MVNSSRDALKTALQKAGADFLEITNTVSLDNEKNNKLNNLSSLQLNLSNLTLSKDSIGEVEISEGILYVKDGENKFVVGKLQTAGFTNEQGLVSQGNNLYEISNETGNIYNAVNLNKLVGSSLEQSKASIANSLTALLIYQKAFEANSKSITTSDDMLQTAIQLKK
jgi:flagellar hook protein FlgE